MEYKKQNKRTEEMVKSETKIVKEMMKKKG